MTCDIKFRFLLTSGNISDERMPNNQLDEKSIVYLKNKQKTLRMCISVIVHIIFKIKVRIRVDYVLVTYK